MSKRPISKRSYGRVDRIAKLYPEVNENETPLPRTFCRSEDKFTYIGLSQNNRRVHYKGVGRDAASVRTNSPIPPLCGLYYFEIKLVGKGKSGYPAEIGVGLCSGGVNMYNLPGWEKDSYGYHADDGHSFCSSGAGQHYGPTFTTGDVIGCGVNLIERTCFYTKNGIHLGIAFRDICSNLYPTVGLQTPGEVVDVNFGHLPFIFNIKELRKELVADTFQTIQNFPVSHNSASWQALLEKMVTGYLTHHGYSATAEAFANSSGQTIVEEPTSIRNRQKIQKLILSGRINEAIETTNILYPTLLNRHPHLFFQLKCRHFIEMVIRCTQGKLDGAPTRSTDSSSSGSNSTLTTPSQHTPQEIPNSMESSDEHTQHDVKNEDSDMVIGENVSNNYSEKEEDYNGPEEEVFSQHSNRTSTNVSVITSVIALTTMQPGPSGIFRSDNSCSSSSSSKSNEPFSDNTFSFEQLIDFGKALQNIYEDITNEIGYNTDSEKLMKDAFSLLAYKNPHDSPVGYLLDPMQREALYSSLNTVILEAHNLPGQPVLERVIGQAEGCLEFLGKKGVAASAMVKVEDFYMDR